MPRRSHGARVRPSHSFVRTREHLADDLYSSESDIEPVSGVELGAGAVTGGSIVDGSVSITKFADTIRPVAIVSSLPTLPDAQYPEDSYVTLSTTHRLYKNIGNVWVRGVNGSDIVADTITAGEIAAGAIGASEISAGAVTADKIAANSVTVGHLARKGPNLLDNSSFEIAPVVGFGTNFTATTDCRPYWDSGDIGCVGFYVNATSARTGTHILRIQGNGAETFPGIFSYAIPVSPGKTYRLSGWGVRAAGALNAVLRMDTRDETDALVSAGVASITYNGAAMTYAEDTYVIPSDGSVSYVRVLCFINNAAPATTDVFHFDDLELVEVPSGVQNTGATVTIDDTGITILNGALTLEDEFSSTVASASGFSGGWADFTTHGVYNGGFSSGITGSIAVGRTADLPYWTFARVSGSPTVTRQSSQTLLIACPTAGNTARLTSDAVTVQGYRLYQVIMPFSVSTQPIGGTISLVQKIQWFDSSGASISTTTLYSSGAMSGPVVGFYHTSPGFAAPSNARTAKVILDVTSAGASNCDITIYSMSLVTALVWDQSTVDLTVRDLTSVGETNIRGVIAIPFVAVGTLPGTGTLDMDLWDSDVGMAQTRIPFGAKVVGISLSLTTARTGGTLTAQAFNGSSTSLVGPTAVIDGTTTNNVQNSATAFGANDFSTGNLYRLRLTGASFTPTANNAKGVLYLMLDVE